ncbi:putative signal transducing protein [Dyella sp. 20L07]|uniref:putative signal transducing protein n=1 Tax=Dyella sp. 20L07 TaxID=3384240 RepID=UPI003D2A8328
MGIDRSTLQQRFKDMSDDELQQRYVSGDMTELAREVADAELRSRGLAPVLPAAQNEPEIAKGESLSESGDVLCLARFINPLEAQVLCARLDAEGIPAVASDVNLIQANPFLTQAVGGVRVLVREVDFSRASEVLEAFRRGDFELADEDQLG